MFARECAGDGEGSRRDVKAATVAAVAVPDEEVEDMTPLALLGSRDAASKRC